MARVRPDDGPGSRLARARVLGAMFGHAEAGAFGRFRVLERLGAGAMGTVYEAYDPNLARGVAVKLVQVAATDREAALAEARALARLSHPNVVPIYEADVEGDHVYFAMELVRGETLRTWATGKRPLEIVQMYRQAGEALAAAHRAGLVHRDFKPDNAVVGADGRVRVVDFGLACEAEDPARENNRPRAVAGTPRFMAPEIRSGGAVLPAADQYSFCVALAEALDGASAPVPRWIATALARGRAAEPTERFASMADLLRALAHDPAQRRRRAAAIAALLVMFGLGLAVASQRSADDGDALDICEQGAAELAAAWSPSSRAEALDRLATLDRYGESVREQLGRSLDAYSSRWTGEYRSACRDRRLGKESHRLSDLRTACLGRGRVALQTVGEVIGGAVPGDLAPLPRAVQGLPDPAACANTEALLAGVEPPPTALVPVIDELENRLVGAQVQLGAGRYPQTRSEAQVVVDAARVLGYAPLLAKALLVVGHAQMMLDKHGAVQVLAEAADVAMSARADAIAVEALARRVFAQGTSGGAAKALEGLEVIESLAKRTADAAFARALLYNNIGTVELARNQRGRAHDAFRRGVAESEKIRGPIPIELVLMRSNLAFVTDDRKQADEHLLVVARELAARLGDDHPDTLMARWLRGSLTTDDLGQSLEYLTAVCTGYELHPALSSSIAWCWAEVGMLRLDLGRRKPAAEALERAARASATEAPEAAPYSILLRGDARAAAAQFSELLTAWPARPDDMWWQRLPRDTLLLGAGRAYRELGKLDEARRALEEAVSGFESGVRASPTAIRERRLGRTRVELALTLSALRAAPSCPPEVVLGAMAWLQRVNATSAEIAALRRLIPGSRTSSMGDPTARGYEGSPRSRDYPPR